MLRYAASFDFALYFAGNPRLVCFFYFSDTKLALNSAPVPGEASKSLFFSGAEKSAWAELGGNALVQELGTSYSVEVWFNYVKKNDYSPILSRFRDSLTGFANTEQDFNLQVWPNGQLCFFMGNGISSDGFLESGYGVLYYGTLASEVLTPNTWHHVALVFEGPENGAPYTPQRVTIYVNGENRASVLWNNGVSQNAGSRQLSPTGSDYPINVGRYNNTDPGIQTLRGFVDEIRFWNDVLDQQTIIDNMRIRLTGKEENLVAYYRCDDNSTTITDSAKSYNGIFKTYSGGEQWSYAVSSVILDQTITTVGATPITITLHATDAEEDTIYYYINSLPTKGRIFDVYSDGTIGYEITSQTITNQARVSSNKVRYVPVNNPLAWDSFDRFDFYARDSQFSSNTSGVWIKLEAPQACTYDLCGICNGNNGCVIDSCDGVPGHVYDECGVCNGDGLSCTCVLDQYRSYNVTELDRILVHYNIQLSLQLIEELQDTLKDTLDQLYETNPGSTEVNLGDAVEAVRLFNNECLSTFMESMDDLLNELI